MTISRPKAILAASILFSAFAALPLTAFAASSAQTPAPATAAQAQAPAQVATNSPMLTNKAGEMSGRGEVRAAQEALNKQNAAVKVDGVLGPRTRAALESFQQAHGLKTTGKLDDKTETALNIQ